MKPKHRMQDVRFRSVEDLFDFLPEEELVIVQHLRSLVIDTIPDVEERLSYNVPYYRRHADICFIWPGSVSWGKKTNEGVRFGFTRGFLLADEMGFLEKGNRTQVYWHDFLHMNEIDNDLVLAYLVNAVDVDEQQWLEKQRTKPRR